jgi:GNAT superfamily N-acetyltransferase
VRRRRDEDLDCVIPVLRGCYEADHYPAFWPEDPRKWLKPLRESWALVATNGGNRLMGHLGVHDAAGHPLLPLWLAGGAEPARTAIISRLIVSPENRRIGCATAMVVEAVRSLVAVGMTPVLDVASDNVAARSLYSCLGWLEVGSPHVTEGRRIPVVAMIYQPTRKISPDPSARDKVNERHGRRARCGSRLIVPVYVGP